MGRFRVGIEVMRTDLERNQAQCFKAHGLDHRHVFRCFEARAGNDGSGTGAYIKCPIANSLPDRFDQVICLKFMQQSESVATTNKYDLRLLNCTQSIRNVVGRPKFKPHLAQAVFGLYTVCPPIMKCVRNEYHPSSAANEISDFSLDMIEIAPTEHRGIAN